MATPAVSARRLLTPREAAELAERTPARIRQLVKADPRLGFKRLGRVLVDEAELLRRLECPAAFGDTDSDPQPA